MKNLMIGATIFSVILFNPSPLLATEGLQPAPQTPEMDEMRGIDQTTQTESDSDPDDWGEGEVILGGDPDANERAKEIGRRLGEQEREEAAPKPLESLSPEDLRNQRRQFRQARELFEKMLEEGLGEEGWRLAVDPNGDPYLEGPEGERIDPESDPDDWGEGEKIL